jgi:glycosyltransferase involved in cell wall biosynthesis
MTDGNGVDRGELRDVLCVAYFFPPLGGVSTARMTAFARHLPRLGWRPIVIAPTGTSYPLLDPGGLARLPPGIEVIRTLCPEPHALRRLVPGARSSLAHRERERSGGVEASAEVVVSGSHRGRLAAVRRMVFFPDDQLAWVPIAAAAGIARVRRNRPDVLFSTAFPVSTHLIAGAIHMATGIPWVAEFRDPWVANVLAPPMPAVQRTLQRRVERWIVRSATRTVLVTPGLTARFRRRYPTESDRMRTIMNGYDPGELDHLGSAARTTVDDDVIRLVYTGTLDRPREMVTFLAGVASFLAGRPEARNGLRIDLIGRRSAELERAVGDLTARTPLGDVLTMTDYVPRSEALDRVRRSSATLVLLGGGPGMDLFVSGKLFDAIGLNRPVFAMVPRGDARAVLEKLDWGIVADPEPDSVAAALERLWNGELRAGVADPAGIFDRRRLSADLATVLDEAADHGS